MPLSTYTQADKNKIVSMNQMLICLSIQIPGVVDDFGVLTPLRIVKNNKDIVWQGYSWLATDFDLDEIIETSKGEVPKVNLNISNRNRNMELYLQNYDFYIKQNGYQPIYVDIYVINTGNVDVNGVLKSDYEMTYRLELKQPKSNDKVVTFELGTTNPYTHRFPLVRLLKNQGKVKLFGDWECGYLHTTAITSSVITKDSLLAHVDIVQRVIAPIARTTFMVPGDSCVYTVDPLSSSTVTQLNFVLQNQSDPVPTWGIGSTVHFLCNKSLLNCTQYNNALRFCGFPGIGVGGIQI